MQPSPGPLTGLRQGNRRRVLEVLRQHGTTSRSEIARQTCLSTTTVSDLVRVLLHEQAQVLGAVTLVTQRMTLP